MDRRAFLALPAATALPAVPTPPACHAFAVPGGGRVPAGAVFGPLTRLTWHGGDFGGVTRAMCRGGFRFARASSHEGVAPDGWRTVYFVGEDGDGTSHFHCGVWPAADRDRLVAQVAAAFGPKA